MQSWMIVAALAAQGAAPDFSWLAGYWLICEGGREVSEIWTDPRGGELIGMSVTLTRAGKVSWEHARVGVGEGGGVAFHAIPAGQPPASFPLLSHDKAEALFENKAHDFPQRIRYRRKGDMLHASIEGAVGGKPRTVSWTYVLRPLNARC
jgi:hypothetical protein